MPKVGGYRPPDFLQSGFYFLAALLAADLIAADHSLDPFQQFIYIKRLGNVIIGALAKPGYSIRFHSASGEKNERNGRGARIC